MKLSTVGFDTLCPVSACPAGVSCPARLLSSRAARRAVCAGCENCFQIKICNTSIPCWAIMFVMLDSICCCCCCSCCCCCLAANAPCKNAASSATLRFELDSESPSRCCAQPLSSAFSAIIATIMRNSRPPRLQFGRVPPVSQLGTCWARRLSAHFIALDFTLSSTVSQICVQQWSELELDRWQLIERAASGVGECQP